MFSHSLGNYFSLFSCARFAFLLFDFQRTLPFGLVGSSGFEPPTLRLSGARSNHLSYEPLHPLSFSLDFRLAFSSFLFRSLLFPFDLSRVLAVALRLVEMTGLEPVNPLLAKQVLSQLSYTPMFSCEFFSKTLKIEQRILVSSFCRFTISPFSIPFGICAFSVSLLPSALS